MRFRKTPVRFHRTPIRSGPSILAAILLASLAWGLAACGGPGEGEAASGDESAEASADAPAHVPSDAPWLVVLGVGQDGGFPQAGMKDEEAWNDPERRRLPVSLGIVDPASGERWMVEATPSFPEQLHHLDRIAPHPDIPGLAGIVLTHAHVGHYVGLIHLGREIIGASGVPVYAMPRMTRFLQTNGPWDQLVELGNIELRALEEGVPVALNPRIQVTPLTVPHRDEYSETVGLVIEGPERSVLFLPDIDKWEEWDALGTRVEDVVARVDVAYLGGTFFADGEIPGRSMAEIPHPFVEESMERFGALPAEERAKIRFIHLNRTNPVGWRGTPEWEAVHGAGFGVAVRGERAGL